MRNDGFTLVEIIVAMAIVSIMAGVIVPISYRIWETKEIEVTRQRMADLKRAMVGDGELYQQGIRTDYGFVGDMGELPEQLADLVTDRGIYPNWQGPYLTTGFDPSRYARDAWGEALIYTPASDGFGRRNEARLVSKGPDRILNTDDDLDVASHPGEQVYPEEVMPASRIEGNLSYTVTVSEIDETPVYYANMVAEFLQFGSPVTIETGDCRQVVVGLVQKLAPRSSSVHYSSYLPANLPVGKVVLRSRFFDNASCSGLPVAESENLAYFVTDGVARVYVNPPPLYVHLVNGP